MSISQSPNDLMHESGNELLAIKTDVLVCADWLTAHSRVTRLLPSSLDCFFHLGLIFFFLLLLFLSAFYIFYLDLFVLLSFPPTLVLPHLLIHIISRIASRPLPCRSVQAPGGTVNALAVPDEIAGPQLLEQDYWWDLGYGWICEYTQKFEAADQWSYGGKTKSCYSYLALYIFIYFLHSDRQVKFYRHGGCKYSDTKNKPSLDWIKPVFPHY